MEFLRYFDVLSNEIIGKNIIIITVANMEYAKCFAAKLNPAKDNLTPGLVSPTGCIL